MKFEELVKSYASNKNSLDEIKKLCDYQNAEIKKYMVDAGINDYEIDDIIIKYGVQHRETVNEDKLLEVMKQNNMASVIKAKEYVDADALEDAIYKGLVPADVLMQIDTCRECKEVETLKISKKKKEKK